MRGLAIAGVLVGVLALVLGGCGESLLKAAERGDVRTVTALLEGGADPNMKGPEGRTPLHLAAKAGHLDVVQELLRQNARAFVKDDRGKTPLHLAAGANHQDIVRLLSQAQSMQ